MIKNKYIKKCQQVRSANLATDLHGLFGFLPGLGLVKLTVARREGQKRDSARAQALGPWDSSGTSCRSTRNAQCALQRASPCRPRADPREASLFGSAKPPSTHVLTHTRSRKTRSLGQFLNGPRLPSPPRLIPDRWARRNQPVQRLQKASRLRHRHCK